MINALNFRHLLYRPLLVFYFQHPISQSCFRYGHLQTLAHLANHKQGVWLCNRNDHALPAQTPQQRIDNCSHTIKCKAMLQLLKYTQTMPNIQGMKPVTCSALQLRDLHLAYLQMHSSYIYTCLSFSQFGANAKPNITYTCIKI